ncbi:MULTISPECIES: TPM domain-containing protein [unclassified Acinetobacter]|uniref:TPM domain-containing protein n=1 Tax=unclassified Acinetobacter TaxID=196816 RepID=UPI0025783195|nr:MULTISPECIES: TPM domain-containing protein [unclassified Acinetobacter]MDM1764126.1 TPM domain-containing protein [Acinetobacter sp. 226-1]MDM1769057.1 TPM domain-containing protein [Acinetobacter sp. 226-4]
MVTKTDTTTILTQPKLQQQVTPSFSRWLKHFFYMPASKRYFSKQDQFAIAEAVKQAEQGHIGEIQVVIEGHIPSNQAYYQNTYLRAQQLFAELGVWDTEKNSGVLLYLNLCEQKVEIVIDRGLKKATQQKLWQDVCDQIVLELKNKRHRQAVVNGVLSIGKILNLYYEQIDLDEFNELPNSPIILN